MKLLTFILFFYASISSSYGAFPAIAEITPVSDPNSIRLNLIESRLGIRSTIWKCSLKEGEKVTFVLRYADNPNPKSSFTLKGPREDYLFLSISDISEKRDHKNVTFGYTGNSDGQSSTIYLGQLTDWSLMLGHRDSSSWRLFDISTPSKKLLFWCDIVSETE